MSFEVKIGVITLVAFLVGVGAVWWDAVDREADCAESCEALGARMTAHNDYGCICQPTNAGEPFVLEEPVAPDVHVDVHSEAY